MTRLAAVKSDLLELLTSRTFLSFFATQFLGAFNDNLFKTALSLLIVFNVAQRTETESSILVNLAAILFILPFFIFSPRAGALADRFEKVMLIQRIKFIEILIMLLAALGFYFGSAWFLLIVLFLMGTQSAFFGPLKYSYLPTVLDRERLVSANALIQGSTFIGIILGMMLAGILFSASGEHLEPVWIAVIFTAALGFAVSKLMVRGEVVAIEASMQKPGFIKLIKLARENKKVWQAILGISWFWMIGATYITQLPNFVRFYVVADEQVFLFCLSLFAIGIGIGAIICSLIKPYKAGRFSVSFGLAGLLIAGLMVSQYSGPTDQTLRDLSQFLASKELLLITGLLFLGISGGLYIVPLYTVLQIRSQDNQRSRMVAMNNIMNAVYMVVSAVIVLLLLASGLTLSMLFLLLALSNFVMLAFFLSRETLFLLDVKKLYS